MVVVSVRFVAVSRLAYSRRPRRLRRFAELLREITVGGESRERFVVVDCPQAVGVDVVGPPH